MSNDNTPPKESSDQTTTDEGLDGAACSPFLSRSLETQELFDRYLHGEIITTRDLFDFARRMEIQRDTIHSALVKLDGITRHEMGWHGFMPDWLSKSLFYQENADVMARREKTPNQTES